jgi:hypothetical protein
MESPKPLSSALIGSWSLLSREDRIATGELRPEPSLGSDPIAFLVFDKGGNFAAQFMRRVPVTEAEPEAKPAILAPNNTWTRGGFDAYFGTYTVDDGTGLVVTLLQGALSRENVGRSFARAITVIGDDLVLRLETATVAGEPVTRTLRWRRVG